MRIEITETWTPVIAGSATDVLLSIGSTPMFYWTKTDPIGGAVDTTEAVPLDAGEIVIVPAGLDCWLWGDGPAWTVDFG